LREKDHLEGPGRDRFEDNIKMPPQELVLYGGVDWVDLAQDGETGDKALMNAVLNLQVPQNTGNILSSRRNASFPRS